VSTASSALGFLTSGTTPGQSQQESESSSSLPSWYTNYTQDILNDAAQYANSGYQAYQGPQVAAQSALTNDAATQSQGVGASAVANTQASTNLINNGVGQVNASVAPGQGGLSAAQGYLNSAATPTSSTVNNYMNPYNTDVTNAIATAGQENFQNNIMPSLNSSIIGGGNITGSSTEGANLAQNAALGEQQAVSQAQSSALQSGYNSSLGAATNEAQIQSGLASTAGQLGTQQQTAEQNAGTDVINAGGALSNVGTQGTANNIAAQQNENAFGNQQQGEVQANENTALANFQAQNNFPLTAASAMQGALSGIQVPTTTTNYGASNGTPATIGNSPIATVASGLGGIAAASGTTSSSLPTYNTATGQYSKHGGHVRGGKTSQKSKKRK
jgi:hypothetical protein